MKKIIVLGILFLFVLLNIIPISGTKFNNNINILSGRGDILYVGGSGPGNYTTIRNAIIDSSDGDIVFVYADSSPYYEHLSIDKSIKLIGENKNTTVIDGSNWGDVINIKASVVTISGFTIQNSGDDYNAGINIDDLSCNNIISNNNIYHNEDGISIPSWEDIVDRNYIFNNDISYNLDCGINIYLAEGNIVEENIISNNLMYGINDGGIEESILNNKVFSNYVGIRTDWEHILISGNEVYLNVYGISLYPGDVSNTMINWNNIYLNSIGIEVSSLGYFSANNIEIRNNNIEFNSLMGLSLWGATSCIITKNNICNNKDNAFFVNTFKCKWDDNYWGSLYKEIKLIKGSFKPLYLIPIPIFPPIIANLFTFPMFNIDGNPAKEPYNYTTTQGCGIL